MISRRRSATGSAEAGRFTIRGGIRTIEAPSVDVRACCSQSLGNTLPLSSSDRPSEEANREVECPEVLVRVADQVDPVVEDQGAHRRVDANAGADVGANLELVPQDVARV